MNAQALVITDNAANKVRQLRDSEGNRVGLASVEVAGSHVARLRYRWRMFGLLVWL